VNLKNYVDRIIYDHEAKVAMIWQSFNEKVWEPGNNNMMFDLEILMPIVLLVDFGSHKTPFTREEIDSIVKIFLINKA
jgi:hypothetical protein